MMSYSGERRKRGERRLVELGPPQGVRDRRQSEQRRATEISELELSDDEWEALFGKAARASEPPAVSDDAAEILDRVRD